MDTVTTTLQRIGPFEPVETFDAESLLKLPATATLEQQLATAAADRGKLPDELARRIREAERRLRAGLARDAVQANRPDGCVCLGTGGVPTVQRGIPYGLVRRYYGEDYERDYVFDAYCDCPDGDRIRREHQARRRGHGTDGETARRERRWQQAGVPPLYAAVTLDNFPASHQTANSVAALRRWLVNDGKPQVLIWGPFGVGKTSLAISLLRALVLDQGRAGLFVTVAELLHELRQAMDTPEQSPDRLLSDLQRLDALVLDDLGAERATGGTMSEWSEEQLYVLLDYRKNHQLRTLITSNLRPADLVEHVGKRIMWRALEHAEVVHLDGPNLRERRPAAKAVRS